MTENTPPPDLSILKPGEILSKPGFSASCILLIARFFGLWPEYLQNLALKPLLLLGRLIGSKTLRWLYLNVQNIYHLPPHSSFARSFADQVLTHQVKALFDSCHLLNFPDHLEIRDFESCQQIANSMRQGKCGAIVITAHLGNWELTGRVMAHAFQQNVFVLAKPSRSKALTQALNYWRQRFAMKVLWTDRKTILKDMIGALRSGTALGFVMDQKPVGRKGPEVTFFGQKVAFVSGPATLACKFDAPVMSLYTMREGRLRYRILCREIVAAGHGITDERQLTQLMANDIERVIRLYPEQWVWNYKRFIWS